MDASAGERPHSTTTHTGIKEEAVEGNHEGGGAQCHAVPRACVAGVLYKEFEGIHQSSRRHSDLYVTGGDESAGERPQQHSHARR